MLADSNIQTIRLYDKDLVLIQVPQDRSMLRCVLTATSVTYRLTGKIDYEALTPLELAILADKVLYIYDALEVRTFAYNKANGVGYVLLYKDLNSRYWLISMQNRYGEYETMFSTYSTLVNSITI